MTVTILDADPVALAFAPDPIPSKNPFKRFWRKLFPKKSASAEDAARRQAYHAYEVSQLRAEITRLRSAADERIGALLHEVSHLKETIRIQDEGIAAQGAKMHQLEADNKALAASADFYALEREHVRSALSEKIHALEAQLAAKKPASKSKRPRKK